MAEQMYRELRRCSCGFESAAEGSDREWVEARVSEALQGHYEDGSLTCAEVAARRSRQGSRSVAAAGPAE